VSVELSRDTALAFLERAGLAAEESAPVEALGWGISNTVIRVGSGDGCVVLKQALARLRVEAEWLFDQDRIFVERRCIDYLAGVLPPGSVPAVRFADDENFLFGMSCAPSGAVLWKEALLQGQVDLEAARLAGRLLAQIHGRSAADSRAARLFDDRKAFMQGRVDPYHRTMLRAHPDLRAPVEAEIERMLATRSALVHGDYSPKNLFVSPGRVFLIDFEVAHWGDPAFDLAFCLNHLALKALAFPERADAYLEAAAAFRASYAEARGGLEDVELGTVRELGCLLLARIDGKSKIEYVTDAATKDAVRTAGRLVLAGEPTLQAAFESIGRLARQAVES
jgi:5-methylthioribose kinase